MTRKLRLKREPIRLLINGSASGAWGTNPGMFVDWEASKGNKVAFPVGLQIGKLRKIGPKPVKFEVQLQYYPVRPQFFGPKWTLSVPNNSHCAGIDQGVSHLGTLTRLGPGPSLEFF
jgi:hypothetical protein